MPNTVAFNGEYPDITESNRLYERAIGLIPALTDEGTTIGQSLAIIEYLDETHPEPPLLPAAPADRARVRAMALEVACDVHPLNNLRVLNYLRGPLARDEDAGGESEPPPVEVDEPEHVLERFPVHPARDRRIETVAVVVRRQQQPRLVLGEDATGGSQAGRQLRDTGLVGAHGSSIPARVVAAKLERVLVLPA